MVLAFPVPEWTGMPRHYICQRTTSDITIDGNLQDSAWKEAPWTEEFLDIQGPRHPVPRHKTTVKMLWDDQYLYIAAHMLEPHVQATLTERDAVIYHDNDFEVFIDPDGDNHLYYELEINALETVWDLLLIKPYRDGAPAVNAWDIQGLQSAVHVNGTLNNPNDKDQGWDLEIAIPFEVLAQCAGRPSPPESGHIWRMNFSRVQWRHNIVDGHYEKMIDPETGKSFPEDNWVWSPQGLIAMHYPENWGEVLFVDEKYNGNADRTINSNREHDSINSARALMDVYYAQKQWYEKHNQFASTVEKLETEYGITMQEWKTRVQTIDGETYTLPYRWTFEMVASENRFTATLCTPRGLMTVDETGRLQRDPLHPPEECSCLKSKH
ncbi:MAG: carbohydrate-binding family 9-like protein [bacterium]|nr:carbohydrate-binding family 9-like protein [bacterium]